jgi:hypothetical protein
LCLKRYQWRQAPTFQMHIHGHSYMQIIWFKVLCNELETCMCHFLFSLEIAPAVGEPMENTKRKWRRRRSRVANFHAIDHLYRDSPTLIPMLLSRG